MNSTRKRIIIVGGGHAGGRVAQALVRDGDDLDVTLISREAHPPYERPPLSKGVLLGRSSLQDCLIWPQSDPSWGRVDVRLGISAQSIDRNKKNVYLDNGEIIGYEKLVLATGSRVRKLMVPGSDLQGIFSLRTIDDSLLISKFFREGKRLLVVGGGFIGLEIAAAAATRGLTTNVVEASDRLLSRIVPKRIGDELARRHQRAGVDFRFGCMVEEFIPNGRGSVKAARLSTGEIVRCDLAIFGVGVFADTSLARAAGLDVEVGIRADQSLRTSDPDIYACGDVVSYWHPVYERHVRVESWQNAEDQARVVAANIRQQDLAYDIVPFFWSDQYDLSMQIVGLPYLASSMVVRELGENAQILFYLDARGRVVGATGLGPAEAIGREIRATRALIDRRATPARGILGDKFANLRTA